MERQFESAIDITHDACAHTQPVSVIGLTEDTEIVCAGCGDTFQLDWELVEEIHDDFVRMLDDKLTAAGIDVEDGAILAFARMHGRLPTEPGDDISPWQ